MQFIDWTVELWVNSNFITLLKLYIYVRKKNVIILIVHHEIILLHFVHILIGTGFFQ